MDRIDVLMEKHAADFDRIRFALVTDFETPAQRIINRGLAQLGIERFDRTGDVWEQIECRTKGWEYTKPPARLMARWAAY